MTIPTDPHRSPDGDPVEARLRGATQGFPGTIVTAGRLDDVVARGRRARTVGRAGRLGLAMSLVAGMAVAAPAVFDSSPTPPTVFSDLQISDHQLVITSPEEGAVVDTEGVTFTGEASEGLDVTVGDIPVDVIDGAWATELQLVPGKQTVKFLGSVDGIVRAVAERTVFVGAESVEQPGDLQPVDLEGPKDEESGDSGEEPKDTVAPDDAASADEPAAQPAGDSKETAPKDSVAPKDTAPKDDGKHGGPKAESGTSVEFTAFQTYGECSEPIPYDEFHGTAEPGSRVWIWSEYGQKEVTVAGNGEWFARVEFPNAPQGRSFEVKAKSLKTGEAIWFDFTNTGEGGSHGEVAFTANQENNHVEHDPPYGYWSGTAPAGTIVEVGSAYGDARTEAKGDGTWRVKVWFEDAPYGTNEWEVVVETSNGDRKTFAYTGTRPEPASDPEPKDPPKQNPPAESVAFTSDQVHDVTDDDPPHSLYVGTANPGEKIWIFSDHGEGYVYTGESGEWELWVEFPTAQPGDVIQVKVKHWDTGEIHTYELEVV